jgi:hypothetical protein
MCGSCIKGNLKKNYVQYSTLLHPAALRFHCVGALFNSANYIIMNFKLFYLLVCIILFALCYTASFTSLRVGFDYADFKLFDL